MARERLLLAGQPRSQGAAKPASEAVAQERDRSATADTESVLAIAAPRTGAGSGAAQVPLHALCASPRPAVLLCHLLIQTLGIDAASNRCGMYRGRQGDRLTAPQANAPRAHNHRDPRQPNVARS